MGVILCVYHGLVDKQEHLRQCKDYSSQGFMCYEVNGLRV